MTMVRKSYVENEPMRLQVVAYRVRDGVLIRRESAGTRDLVQLDVLWKATTSDTDNAVPVALQAGVTGMQVLGWTNGQWQAIQAPLSAALGAAAPQPGATDGLQVVLQVTRPGRADGQVLPGGGRMSAAHARRASKAWR